MGGSTFTTDIEERDDGHWRFIQPTPLASGPHNVEVHASLDGEINGGSSITRDFTVDATAPNAPELGTPAEGALTNGTPIYSGTADPGSKITVTVDDSPLASSATAGGDHAWSLTQSPPSLSNGTHSVKAMATDSVGNPSADSATHQFTVDGTAPDAPELGTPAEGALTNGTPIYSGTAEAHSIVTVIVDDSPLTSSATADDHGAWSLTPQSPPFLSNGTHSVKAMATDSVGNPSTDSTTHQFTVDVTAPGAPVLGTPTEGALTNGTPIYSGTAEAGSKVTVTVSFDGSPPTSINTTANDERVWTITQSPGFSRDGTYSFNATATDSVGNTSNASPTRTFTVDATPPNAPTITAPEHNSYTKNKRPVYSGKVEPSSSIIMLSLNGSSLELEPPLRANADGDWDFEHPLDLADGAYTATVLAKDEAGNVSRDINFTTFTIDTVPPQAPVFKELVYDDGTLSLIGTAEPENRITISVDPSGTNTTVSSDSQGHWIVHLHKQSLGSGSHNGRAYATDRAGNRSTTEALFTFIVDKISPTTPVVTFPTSGAVLKTARPRFSGKREPNSSVTVNINVADGQIASCTTEAALSHDWVCDLSESLSERQYSIVAIARDIAGNESEPSSPVSFTVIPQLPEVLSPRDGDVINDSTPTLTGTAASNAEITITVDGIRDFTTMATLNGAWSKEIDQGLSEGLHTITITAYNAREGSNSTTFSITVDLTPPDTLFSPDSPTLVVYPPSATFTFSSLEEGNFECSLDEADFSPCASPVALEDVTAGEHRFRVRAQDKAGNMELEPATYSWTREMAALEGSGCSIPGSTMSGVLAGLSLILLAVAQRTWRARNTPATRKNLLP